MIDYSIKKPHALCGHFIKINNKAEYQEVKAIAEGCGFERCEPYIDHGVYRYSFNNDVSVKWYHETCMTGQEITLPELRELATLSKLMFPMKMEVVIVEGRFINKTVVDFYKGYPIIRCVDKSFFTAKGYRLPNPNAAEIEKLEKEIEGLKARINTLKGEETK